MAAAPTNFPNAGHFYSNVTKPVEIDLNFIVDSTNGNGLGISSLKSNGYVKNVFMHTSATAAGGNPNPGSGYAMIQLAGNYNKYLGGFSSLVSPPTGSALKIDNGATLTIGQPYTITTLGNATAAQWTLVGVPAGVTPALGLGFIAIATGGGSGNTSTSRVNAVGVSGISAVEVIGDTNQAIANSNVAANGGAWLLVQFLAATNSSTTTLTPTAPANNSAVGMTIKLDASSTTVDGL